jgi:hypothetical protein
MGFAPASENFVVQGAAGLAGGSQVDGYRLRLCGHWWVTDAARTSVPPGMHNNPRSAARNVGGVHKRQVSVVHLSHCLSNGMRLATFTCDHDTEVA